MMQIRYQKPLDTESINLSFTFFTICLIGLLFMNFSDMFAITALSKTLCNIILIPILFLMLVFIAVNYYDHAKSKKSLGQIISEYNGFSKLPLDDDSKLPLDDEKFKGFYKDDRELNLYNYKPLRDMPKNIAPYFMVEKE